MTTFRDVISLVKSSGLGLTLHIAEVSIPLLLPSLPLFSPSLSHLFHLSPHPIPLISSPHPLSSLISHLLSLSSQPKVPSCTDTPELLSWRPNRLGHATFLKEDDGHNDEMGVVAKASMGIEICLSSNLLCVPLSLFILILLFLFFFCF